MIQQGVRALVATGDQNYYYEGTATSAAIGVVPSAGDVFKLVVSTTPNIDVTSAAQLEIDPAGTTSLESFDGQLHLTADTTVFITATVNNVTITANVDADIVSTTGDINLTAAGTNVSSLSGTGGLVLANAAAGLLSTTAGFGTNGQIPIAATAGTPVFGNITSTGGITVTNGAHTIALSGNGSGFTWTTVVGATVAAAGHGYFANAGGGLTFTLPAGAAAGDAYCFVNIAGGFTINLGGGQAINAGITNAVVSVESTNVGDSLMVICQTGGAAGDFWVINSTGTFLFT